MTEEILDKPQELQQQETQEQMLMELFHQYVINFKLRWISKNAPVSQAGLYNYAMSVMRYEFHNKFDKETAKKLVETYKPN
jgi:hypothetical protein